MARRRLHERVPDERWHEPEEHDCADHAHGVPALRVVAIASGASSSAATPYTDAAYGSIGIASRRPRAIATYAP